MIVVPAGQALNVNLVAWPQLFTPRNSHLPPATCHLSPVTLPPVTLPTANLPPAAAAAAAWGHVAAKVSHLSEVTEKGPSTPSGFRTLTSSYPEVL